MFNQEAGRLKGSQAAAFIDLLTRAANLHRLPCHGLGPKWRSVWLQGLKIRCGISGERMD